MKKHMNKQIEKQTTHQTSGAEVLGSNLAYLTIILMRCRGSLWNNVEKLWDREGNLYS